MDTERRNGSYPGNSQWTFFVACLLADVFRDVGVGPMKMLGCGEVTA